MGTLSELNHDLLVEIAAKLTSPTDFLAFRVVSTSCRSAASLKHFIRKFRRVPLLMLAPERGQCSSRRFFNLSDGMTSEFILPELGEKMCLPSKGWLLTIAKDLSTSLLHVFSPLQIQLPHLNTFGSHMDIDEYGFQFHRMYSMFINKFVLSSDPLHSDSDYTAMVIYGTIRRLAFYRSGDKAWTPIKTFDAAHSDITYYKGKFYAVDLVGNIKSCDIRGDTPTVLQVARLPPDLLKNYIQKAYVVESAGELLVVARYLEYDDDDKEKYGTCDFEVFKLELSTNTFTVVENLGNRALFLGHNSSLSVQILDASEQCKSNCIYFTDDTEEAYEFSVIGGGQDMGIYNMQDGSIEKHFAGSSYHHITPPMWVEPCLEEFNSKPNCHNS